LECFDEKPSKCVGGDKGLTKSINCTINLANLAHYNSSNEGVGIGIWFEREKHVYFVMPNVMIVAKKENGKEVNVAQMD